MWRLYGWPGWAWSRCLEDDMKFEHEIEREQEDTERRQRTGVESYEQKLDRWREGWRREIDDDLDNGR